VAIQYGYYLLWNCVRLKGMRPPLAISDDPACQ
jgi:hypothetical protein